MPPHDSLSMDSAATWFDSHCHLDFDEFDSDRETLWAECRAAGIHRLMIPGVTPGEQWNRSAHWAAANPGVYYSLGFHPCWLAPWQHQPLASVVTSWQADIARHLQSPLCRALGETGLDKRITTPLALQQQWLEWHIDLARQYQRPLMLHCVHAHAEMLALLKQHRPAQGGVVHAFSGSYEIAREYWALGFYLGIGGTITYERANKTRDAAKRLPLDAIVLETDAPDMPLQGRQGQRNSPIYLPQVAACLAQLRGEDCALIQQQVYHNTLQLFRLPQTL